MSTPDDIGELRRRIWRVTDRLCEDQDIEKILNEAANEILSPVMDKTFDNTGKAYMMPDGIDIVLDTRNAERKLALVVRSVFKWFGEKK